MPTEQSVFKEHLSLIVLSCLKGGPKYGYELVQLVKHRSQGSLEMREGVLYPLLHRMVGDGFLSSEWVAVTKGQDVDTTRLTAKGKKLHKSQLSAWQQFTHVMNGIVGATA